MKKKSIKLWALDDRPREKLMLKGKAALSSAELIAIIIGSGNREQSAVGLSQKIVASVNNDLNALAKLSLEELMSFKGIGEAKAISIVTALEIGKRRQFIESNRISKITSSLDAATILQPLIGDLGHEEFWVLYLNNSNKVVAKHQLSKGGFTATLVDVRLLYQKALKVSAVGIIVAHNHPSGKLKPSNSDIQLTAKIKQAGVTLDIKLLDHLIITEKTYFSFADQEML
ncbi:DNA repair protein RadC [Tenacibaculum finnmarkense genomovar finnmarkense]|uniref:DNA repair protein RadC n=1 Tax=Tenacibaculum finnmarkense genomovar finnmarkense TaxID=1458503 RepID=A0AAP1RGR6_9FLAO|nr:DNA repair protein RadC [Tenacibaculum finnmarkense]MBE7653297.1 DNA repair protein RadC [Tenacibaculum finnmarkense genomovar finnmarkense]MBE7661211.1 DNA repair protein RadC [Tenacibaculum finnmarkense genomovar finnmarkense]MBE7695598.1 DNA repair protein RadC [Tenacibaculum finnmarkense genomovar finnmarkense]MCD8403676.1 DNA repair protein RadC [Tenacibaculum finnmarkense genomovar finnmarkense]MCD8412438.1 DNA repair protein RadC [Tenacibaculum finnmarkense genomovar ulcerans]